MQEYTEECSEYTEKCTEKYTERNERQSCLSGVTRESFYMTLLLMQETNTTRDAGSKGIKNSFACLWSRDLWL